ncbi:MAG TPA: 2-succinylbenzoate-CoA ligase [Cyanothece sp. UBA12306]|nr:2-succinylbenzoate-CoA ligase [Cyanothece sp. UBA12306]
MEELLIYLKNLSNESWLIEYDSYYFYQNTQYFIEKINQIKSKINSPKIILAESDQYKFLAAFLAGVMTNCPIFLCNYQWGKSEWQQVFSLVQPDLIIGLEQTHFFYQLLANNDENKQNTSLVFDGKNTIMIPTGGSSGKIRFAIHTWGTLSNSVKGFIKYFKINKVDSFCCLPLYHVSGLMQFMRSFLTQGKLALISYSTLKKGVNLDQNISDFFISLVPTQLQLLLELCPNWLAQFNTVLLGGASPNPLTLETAKKYKINLAITYGMTETASQIVTLKPQDFLQGNNSTGQVLPHAEIRILDSYNNSLAINKIGTILIKSSSLFLGYYPKIEHPNTIMTDDLGYLDQNNYLSLIGRKSQKIITGGENVYPQEIETVILATGMVKDVAVIGTPHRHWGQAVTAVYIPKTTLISSETIQQAIEEQISKFKQPKYWICVDNFSRNQQGKINYKKLQEIAINYLNSQYF